MLICLLLFTLVFSGVFIYTMTRPGEIYTRKCFMCHIGEVKVKYHGEGDQFTETIESCKECGWKPDEFEGC